tara:strand:+ start:341 stop:787 length:447 start_codon:yes stop_codon:yes gene_type:complete
MKKHSVKYFLKKSNNIFIRLFLIYFFSISCNFSYAQKEEITIKNCYDGDTCTTTDNEKIRLACIDTPEIKGKRADSEKAKYVRDYLNNLIKGKKIKIRRIAYDRYGRTVAELYKNKKNIQKHLVDIGLAKVYKKYAYQCNWSENYLIN